MGSKTNIKKTVWLFSGTVSQTVRSGNGRNIKRRGFYIFRLGVLSVLKVKGSDQIVRTDSS
jgi:hypothetical protein